MGRNAPQAASPARATTEPRRTRGTAVSLGRLFRRAVMLALGVLLLWGGAIVVLGIAYNGVMPVSTLMLARWLTGQEATRVSVPFGAIASDLGLAVLTSEDQRFCTHGGVDWDALRDVIEEADEEGPSRGASTVSMQTAKNLFLWPGRSYLRKGLEIPLALYLDAVMPKRRMMEIYLNIAEWGPGIFGAEAAAQRYFGKSARALTRREAALLVAALPNPIRRNPARPSARHQALAKRLVSKMDAASGLAGCMRT